MSHLDTDTASRPPCWVRAAATAPGDAGSVPAAGEHVAVTGYGVSLHETQDYAGQGPTEQARSTGARRVEGSLGPLGELVRVHHAAVALAKARGHGPDQPRDLTRSVVLTVA
ncbi:hypothetical protein [Kitasatospora indigofera]|uniref:hypothetical protein n=1 Tax=Kitasatospora indigofera TaxID=67307 RepID=UPI003F4BBA09